MEPMDVQVDNDIKSLEYDIATIESFQNGSEWDMRIQETASQIMAQADEKIDTLMLDKLNKEQVVKMVELLARFTKLQDVNNPRRVLPIPSENCCDAD